MEKPSPLVDLKEALSSSRKPDITHVRSPFMNYTARACELGDDKYERANYLRPIAPGGYTGTPTPADFKRFRAYLRAAVSHVFKTLDAMEEHQANDPKLLDVEGMKAAAYSADTDETPGARVGASGLPHVAHACASLQMAICQAAASGLLPEDPGRTWNFREDRAAASVPPTPTPYEPYDRAVAAFDKELSTDWRVKL